MEINEIVEEIQEYGLPVMMGTRETAFNEAGSYKNMGFMGMTEDSTSKYASIREAVESLGSLDKPAVYYQNMPYGDVKKKYLDKGMDTVILPVGATAVHGDKTKYVGEDGLISCRISEELARRTGVLVAQPFWYSAQPGMDTEYQGIKGDVALPEHVVCDMLRHTLAGLWNTGFRKIIIVHEQGQDEVITEDDVISWGIKEFQKKWPVPAVI